MKRPIRFRAWDKEREVMVTAQDNRFYIDFGGKPHAFNVINSTYIIPNWEIMQSTGLKDKNGKEIFEGDILKTDSGSNMKVEYREDMACFVCRFNTGGSISIETAWEVIGNIYEHPNLI